MSYSLQQAAISTGKNRSTIQRAIKSGRISAALNEAGAYEIDPAELHRVFPPVLRNMAESIAVQQNATDEIASENRELKAKVELLREMVDDLRHRLDEEADERRQSAAEIRRLTLMLTDRRQLPPQDEASAPATVRPVFWIALAAATVAAAAWYFWP